MKISELFEAEESHVTFCFGRVNPPTRGHEHLFKVMESVGGDYKIFLTQTQDRKENPLDYESKIKFVKAMFPNHSAHVVEDRNLNTIVKVASYLYDQGYKNCTFVAGDDRLEQLGKVLKDYNGIEGKAHGFYKFDLIDLKSSGKREEGSDGVEGIKAGNARMYAATGDLEKFKEVTGAGEYADLLYSAVREGLGIKNTNESLDEDWRKKLAALGMAGVMGVSSAAGAADHPPESVKEPIIATLVIDGQTKRLDLTPKGFDDVRDAEKWLDKFLQDRGIMQWQGKIERSTPGTGKYQRVIIQ